MVSFTKAAITVGGDIPTLVNIDALRNYTPRGLRDGISVIVAGSILPGDAKGGVYVWDDSNALPDDGFNVVKPLTATSTGRWLLSVGSADLTGATGSAQVGFRQTNAIQTTDVQSKLRKTVAVSDFGTDTAAFIRALDTNAREVIVDIDVTVTSQIIVRDNQVIRFAGGRIIVPATHSVNYPDAVLHSNGGTNITLINPIIDASATSGVVGIRLLQVTNANISRPTLRKCNIALEAYDNTNNRNIVISDAFVDCMTYRNTAIYVSGLRGVSIRSAELKGSIEGVGIYNGARSIRLTDVVSHDHSQDGFVCINGQEISHVNCSAYNNGQSGFTTQRQNAADNARNISWVGCKAYDNAADGFDIRGANSTPWGVDTMFVLSSCWAQNNGPNNGGCGFYIVAAEGTTLEGCTGYRNKLQNLFIHTSDRVIVTGFRSISGASNVDFGQNKAGILVFNSNSVQMIGAISGNADSVQQEYGICFTGTSANGRVIGGDFSNNKTLPFFDAKQNSFVGALADTLGGAGIFLRSVSQRGTYDEEGFGVPTHTRQRGSMFTRLDAGFVGELYISNGAGSWSMLKTA